MCDGKSLRDIEERGKYDLICIFKESMVTVHKRDQSEAKMEQQRPVRNGHGRPVEDADGLVQVEDVRLGGFRICGYGTDRVSHLHQSWHRAGAQHRERMRAKSCGRRLGVERQRTWFSPGVRTSLTLVLFVLAVLLMQTPCIIVSLVGSHP